MKRGAAALGLTMLALAACAEPVPAPNYPQSRAIDQDIEATHVVGPTATSPAFTEHVTAPALTPWRNEETIDSQREQTGELPR